METTIQTHEEQQILALQKIEEQRRFGREMADFFRQAVVKNYGDTGEASDTGSYSRGTNTDPTPDLDIFILNVPKDQKDGFVDWTSLDTKDLTGSDDGIVELNQIKTGLNNFKGDDKLHRTILDIMDQMREKGWQAEFNWARSWKASFPGVIVNLKANGTLYGNLEFDIALYHGNKYFGVEHTRLFNDYIDKVVKEHGSKRALQLLEDIRRLKKLVKTASDNGRDKTRKVPGFIVESLFVHGAQPLIYKEVIKNLAEHKAADEFLGTKNSRIQDQETRLVGSEDCALTMEKVLESPALSHGGYNVLKSIAKEEVEKLSQED